MPGHSSLTSTLGDESVITAPARVLMPASVTAFEGTTSNAGNATCRFRNPISTGGQLVGRRALDSI